MVPPTGIEPVSSDFQSAAMTTSATATCYQGCFSCQWLASWLSQSTRHGHLLNICVLQSSSPQQRGGSLPRIDLICWIIWYLRLPRLASLSSSVWMSFIINPLGVTTEIWTQTLKATTSGANHYTMATPKEFWQWGRDSNPRPVFLRTLS